MSTKRTNRLLVIEKLVVAIPDDYGADPNKITIDEALQIFLQQRQTAKAVLFNTSGNYVYFNAAIPAGVNPEDPNDFTSNLLAATLGQNPDLDYAGLLFTLVYDEDLGGYRNIYNPQEEKEFNIKKALYLQSLKEKEKPEEGTENTQETPTDEEAEVEKGAPIAISSREGSGTEDADTDAVLPCECCDQICDERCPNDSYVEE